MSQRMPQCPAPGNLGSEQGIGSASLQSWRRVSSTHKLEDLLRGTAGEPKGHAAAAMYGLLLCCAAAGTAVVALIALCSGELLTHDLRRQDIAYYVQALAALVPVTVCAAFASWFSNKLFKHNT